MSFYTEYLKRELRKRAVWDKGHKVLGYDPDIIRKDDEGYWIRYTDYKNRDSEYGWEIDHIFPIALGGSDELSNLRPRFWRANARHGGLLGGRLA